MPGPLLTVTIDSSSRLGVWGGLASVTGHALIELLLVIGLMLGLASLLNLPVVTGIIGSVGGMVLVWLGFGMYRAAPSLSLELSRGGSRTVRSGDYLKAVSQGALASVTNPYWSLWWATIGTSYFLLWAEGSSLKIGSFFVGHILSDYLWFGFIAVAVVFGRKFVSDRLYRKIVAVLGVVLIGFGIYFAFGGVVNLLT